MKKCIIIGKANTGKSLFMINFAEYLGLTTITLNILRKKEPTLRKTYTIKDARQYLSHHAPFKTLNIQYVTVEIPAVKRSKTIQLIDSGGLTEEIHEQYSIRKSMADTLFHLKRANIILHFVDPSSVFKRDISTPGQIDFNIASYGSNRGNYAIIANKMDLPESQAGLKEIKRLFPNNLIIPVSALKKTGFEEVKAFVSNAI
ncbi:MAG TPA: GTP-binding protein HSR1 [Clostridiales bacterium]|nr:GTP-binding protein HSR1 [Clostridiales bacterium]